MTAPADIEAAMEMTLGHVARELAQIARTLKQLELLLQLIASAREAAQ
jgi:hypothetical protein